VRVRALQRSPHPNPPPQGGRESRCAFDVFPLPPCGGGLGWGVPPHPAHAKVTRWRRHARGNCGAIRQRRKSACGRSFDSSRSTAIDFGDKSRLDLTSSTSSVSRADSSPKWMADSTTTTLRKTAREPRGWRDRTSMCCVSGTTRCSAISRASTKSSSHTSLAASPHPNPPPQGGRGFAHSSDVFPLPPCGGGSGSGWGVSRRAGVGATMSSAKRKDA
jgi:hypothetical protein